jgi:hypothetical protein
MAGPGRFESLIDQQIRAAQERGEFDDLPGMGEPLPGRGQPDDELWWVRGLMQREGISGESFLPASLRLAKELERLPESVRDYPSEQRVRAAAQELNERIDQFRLAPRGPHVTLRKVDPDDLVVRCEVVEMSEHPPLQLVVRQVWPGAHLLRLPRSLLEALVSWRLSLSLLEALMSWRLSLSLLEALMARALRG